MLQAGGGAGFAIEARATIFVAGEVGQHRLDGDFAIEHRIVAAEERTHAATTDAVADFVAADGFAGLHTRPVRDQRRAGVDRTVRINRRTLLLS
jgi:hypothetical protein